MAIKKQAFNKKGTTKVTFTLPEAGIAVQKAVVLGEFNAWNSSSNELKKQKDGSFKTTLELENGKSYAFRYLVNDSVWMNDLEADSTIPAGMAATENAVIAL
ncbi:MAG: isoamylase early set domain-containing protein [Saprospiraceae bacterium]